MPQYNPPDSFPDWAENSSSLVSAPTPSQQQSGFTLGQRPTAQTINWLFRQLGRSVRWLSQGVNAVLVGAGQETDYRLIGGGQFGWVASTGVLSWSDTLYISTPGLADSVNALAAGSVTLTAGQVAYVAANVPFGTTGTTTSGSATVTALAYESGIVVGATCTGPGIPTGATVTAISTQDSSITLSAKATASAANVNLVFATSGALTAKVADVARFVPSSATVVFARCVAGTNTPNHVLVGVNAGQFRLDDAEQKRMLRTGYGAVVTMTAGEALAAQSLVYVSQGGAADAQRTPGQLYLATATSVFAGRATVLGMVMTATPAGSMAEVVTSGRVSYSGTLTAGTVHYLGSTPGSLQSGVPISNGLFAAPIGYAATANTLLLSCGTAPISTTLAYKSVIDLGSYWSRNSPAGAQSLVRFIYDTNGSLTAPMAVYRAMTHAGSIVGVTIHANNTITANTTVNIFRGSTRVLSGVLNANNLDSAISFSIGSYPFAAGDVFSSTVAFSNNSGQAVTGVNIALDATMTVEMTP